MDLEAADAAFDEFVEREPEFIIDLKNPAFVTEREIARQKDAKPFREARIRTEKNSLGSWTAEINSNPAAT